MIENNLLQAMAGGAFIGIAGGAMLLLNGRVLGVSGIVAHSLTSPKDSVWRLCFLAGLILAPLVIATIEPNNLAISLPSEINIDIWQLLIGAFLVGVGTSLGSGCTSGHGVCGIGRFSNRSVVATVVFMLVAMATVFIIRNILI